MISNRYSEQDHTFVVCAYKESPFLETCLKSLLKQTKKSNVIMATSTPCDYISNMADKYGITLHVNPGEGGIANDWNFGYSKVTTPLVTIAHQDDVYSAAYLEYMLDAFNQAKKPLIGFSDYGELRNNKRVYNNKLLKIKKILLFPMRFKFAESSRFIRRRCLSLGSCICCPSVTFAKENLPEVVFENNFKSNLDWEAWEKISKLDGDFLYCNKPLMLHRIHEDSETSHIIGYNKRTKEDYLMFCHFWPKPIAKLIAKAYSSGEKSNNL